MSGDQLVGFAFIAGVVAVPFVGPWLRHAWQRFVGLRQSVSARRLAEGAERNGLVAGAPAPPEWAPQPIGPNPGQRTEVNKRVAR
jgi:hypothetical protein